MKSFQQFPIVCSGQDRVPEGKSAYKLGSQIPILARHRKVPRQMRLESRASYLLLVFNVFIEITDPTPPAALKRIHCT